MAALLSLAGNAMGESNGTYQVGVAKIDITPKYPIRLNGFGFRRTESEGVTQPIWAKALAINGDDQQPFVLITLDSLGIRETMVEEVAARLKRQFGIERDRLAVTFSHSHTTPKVAGACDTIFSTPIPPEHQAHIDRYTAELTDAIEAVAVAALADRKPSTLSWAAGNVGFAKYRRHQGGPVDHSLPVMVVKSADDGKLRAVYTTYACHCVTLSNNKISGDWAGFAQQAIEERHPGIIAMTSIGCGSDANPESGVTGDNIAIAADQGDQIADEVDRILGGPLQPIHGPILPSIEHIDLPLNPPPSEEELKTLAAEETPAGYNAKFQLAKLQRGEKLQTSLDYPIQILEFGDSLAMVFLGGEVCCDYAVELRKQLDPDRTWYHGYSNDFCAYIPSERLLREQGYGGGAEIVYFALPNTIAPGLEQKILSQVTKQVSAKFLQEQPADAALEQPWPLEVARKSIKTKPGFIVEVAASEPLVADPVAIDFAPDGRLWVAEMPDYSRFAEAEFEQHGSVRLLADEDADGRYDKYTTFVEGLRFPTDVKAWRGGVIVCDAPDVIFFKDTDGDGCADVRKVLLTGFETTNAQARVNSLRWGLDNWLYGSCGLLGGNIRSTMTGREIALGQRDFRFRPDTGEFEPVSARSQQGRARNDWGDWFGCENSSLLDHYLMLDRYIARNPRLVPPPPEVSAPVPSAKKLHPIGPETLFKLSGPPGRPTAVCGLDIYRDELLGAEYSNNAFVAEPANQLVHRLVLSPRGTTFTGNVASDEKDVEFLASTDPWFRPVQIRTGPDGCLYVVDMHRAVIEHQKFIPEESLRELDITAGRDEGRIYRIRPAGVQPRPIVDLSEMSVAELVQSLDSPNGPQRDQVQELLVQQGDMQAVPLLRKLIEVSTRPTTRLQALCTLDGLAGLEVDTLASAMNDKNAAVRRRAIRLSEPLLASSPTLRRELLKRVDDPDPQVQLQLACSLGELNDPNIASALADIALASPQDPYLLAGVWSSVNAENVGPLLVLLIEKSHNQVVPASVIEPAIKLAFQLGGPNTIQQISKALVVREGGVFQPWELDIAAKLLQNIRQQGSSNQQIREQVAPLVSAARRTLENEAASDAEMLASLRVVAAASDTGDITSLLEPFLESTAAPALQQEAVELAMSNHRPERVDLVLAAWHGLTSAARQQAFSSIAASKELTDRLLERLESGELVHNSLDAAQRQQLLNHPDAAIRSRATAALASSINTDRDAIVKEYLSQVDVAGNPSAGKEVFAKNCSSCHVLEGIGHKVGPDLAALSLRTPLSLAESILDPNRAVDERFRSYTALTADGLTTSGILTAETSNSVTLVDQQARQHVLLRADLELLTMSGVSLMPDGLEREITPTAFNDLIAYLTQLNSAAKVISGNRPEVISPSWEEQVSLQATDGAIFGDEITFEQPLQNIGYWHGADDYVRWEFELPRQSLYDVYLESACNVVSAGSKYAVIGGDAPLLGEVAATGGYNNYRLEKIGTVSFSKGKNSLIVRPYGKIKNRNLMDLRAVYLTLPGNQPHRPSTFPLQRDATKAIADLVAKITDKKSEYEHIPQLWELSTAIGRRNNAEELAPLLELAIPQRDAPLEDWQAVVLGGGVVKGISEAGDWPQSRISELLPHTHFSVSDWEYVLQQAAQMADDPSVHAGTRYDALRILGASNWDACAQTILKYLTPEAAHDLQIGAVAALSDLNSPEVTKQLVDAVKKLTGNARRLAVEGLLRTDQRAQSLAIALSEGQIDRELLTIEELSKLREKTLDTSQHNSQ